MERCCRAMQGNQPWLAYSARAKALWVGHEQRDTTSLKSPWRNVAAVSSLPVDLVLEQGAQRWKKFTSSSALLGVSSTYQTRVIPPPPHNKTWNVSKVSHGNERKYFSFDPHRQQLDRLVCLSHHFFSAAAATLSSHMSGHTVWVRHVKRKDLPWTGWRESKSKAYQVRKNAYRNLVRTGCRPRGAPAVARFDTAFWFYTRRNFSSDEGLMFCSRFWDMAAIWSRPIDLICAFCRIFEQL